MTLYAGTSGWAYKEWKPSFYPKDLPQRAFLDHYATKLTACEINATFYRLQTEATFSKWTTTTPPGFRFAAKAHRRITHGKAIAPWRDPDDDEKRFFDTYLRSVGAFGDRAGPILFQFPPYRRRDDAGLERLLDALPEGKSFACEFRHGSWSENGIGEMIAARGGTVCLSNVDGTVPPSLPRGPIGYIRLRTDRYDSTARDGWRNLLLAEAATRDVYAFAKHEGLPADDPYGGVGLAVWIAEQAGGGQLASAPGPRREDGAKQDQDLLG